MIWCMICKGIYSICMWDVHLLLKVDKSSRVNHKVVSTCVILRFGEKFLLNVFYSSHPYSLVDSLSISNQQKNSRIWGVK